MPEKEFWLDRLRIALIVAFSCYLWRFFDPTAYAPLNPNEMRSAALWLVALASAFALGEGREAFVISVYLMAPIKFLADVAYFWRVLIPTAELYDNWRQFVFYDLTWSAPFYLLLILLCFNLRARALGLLGLVSCIWVFPLALLIEGLQVLMLEGLKVTFADQNYRNTAIEDVGIVILLSVILMRVLWPLRIRSRNREAAFDARSCVALQSLLDSIGKATGVETHPRICLSALPNISIDLDGERLGLEGRRVLVIGLPLLAVLSKANLRSLLAHEYAHFSRRHFGLHSVIYRTLIGLSHYPGLWLPRRRSLAELAAAAQRFWLYGPLLLPLAAWLRTFMRPVRWRFELEADLEAARITGVAGTMRALQESAAARLCYLRRSGGAAPAPSLWEPDEFEGFRTYWFSKQGQGERLEALKELESAATLSGDDYPSLRDRLRSLQSVTTAKVELAQPDADEPAYQLFADSLVSLQEEFVGRRQQTQESVSHPVGAGMQFAPGMGALPEDEQQERREGQSQMESLHSVWSRWVEGWRNDAWHGRIGKIAVVLAIVGAVASVEYRVVNNVAAQRRLLEAEVRLVKGDISDEEAITAFQHAIKMNSNYARAYNDLGYALGEKKEWSSAIEQYNHAIRLNPHYPLAYLNSGRTHYYLGLDHYSKEEFSGGTKEFANAIEGFNRSASLDRGTGSPQHSLGVVYRTMYKVEKKEKNLENAKSYFRDAVTRPHVPEIQREQWNKDYKNPGGQE
jgi:tetratricopeptide (TPR) repeat protein